MVATTGDPKDGGVVLCPVQGCACYSTWSPSWPGKDTSTPPVHVPDRFELEMLREHVQS